jgi:hypothetical protein
MKQLYKWRVKKLNLKKEVICEFEFEALQKIGQEILEGRFTIEIEKKELEEVKTGERYA